MKNFDLKFIVEATEAQALSDPHKVFSGVGTDTRKDLTGQLFIALKGEQFDAHSFLKSAIEKGAHGVLVHDWPKDLDAYKNKVTVIKVKDTLIALQKLAKKVRHQLKPKVVALTGSNGKTTTKEFTAAILEVRYRVHYSKGSFNNHWGLPFSLLDLEKQHEVAVLEMGMNHAGEIAQLVKIAEPDIVTCTSVGRAHIEHFGSQEGIAKAKEEIYEFSPTSATRVYNIDDTFTEKMWQRGKGRFKGSVITFSNSKPHADVFLEFQSMNLNELVIKGHIQGEESQVRVAIFGKQNMVNLAAAAALSLAAGMEPQDIWKGLENCRTNWGRNQLLKLKSGGQMIFDGYNANPDSMKALVDNLKNVSVTGRKIGVFGEMLELGDFSASYHKELGENVARAGFESVYFVGPDAEAFKQGLSTAGYKNKMTVEKEFKAEVAQALANEIKSGDLVVIKGSRGMKLERFVMPCEPLDFNLSKE
jgi:UDP-N-acetylmuramoyl-tripeptide--D-alanyl-D-alanine ligase